MPYTRDVKFSCTDKYGCGPKGEDDVYTIEGFLDNVRVRAFINYDGFGYPVKDGKCDPSICIKPSTAENTIPKDATHIVWYNR